MQLWLTAYNKKVYLLRYEVVHHYCDNVHTDSNPCHFLSVNNLIINTWSIYLASVFMLNYAFYVQTAHDILFFV